MKTWIITLFFWGCACSYFFAMTFPSFLNYGLEKTETLYMADCERLLEFARKEGTDSHVYWKHFVFMLCVRGHFDFSKDSQEKWRSFFNDKFRDTYGKEQDFEILDGGLHRSSFTPFAVFMQMFNTARGKYYKESVKQFLLEGKIMPRFKSKFSDKFWKSVADYEILDRIFGYCADYPADNQSCVELGGEFSDVLFLYWYILREKEEKNISALPAFSQFLRTGKMQIKNPLRARKKLFFSEFEDEDFYDKIIREYRIYFNSLENVPYKNEPQGNSCFSH